MPKSRWTMLLFAFAFTVPNIGSARGYPEKPVRVILPFPGGTSADTVVRTVTERLADAWGQPVIVDNRPGAGGVIGVTLASRSQPDGYVILAHSSSYAVNAAVYAKLPYDPIRDFIPVAPIGTQPYVLVTALSGGLKSVSELIATAKSNTRRIDFGSAGTGSSTHLIAEKFRKAASIDAVHVPYRNIADMMSDTIGGRIGYWFPPIGAALPLVRDARLTALAVTGTRRSAFLPEVHTFSETGFAGLDDTNWFGIWAPTGTPAAATKRIATDTTNAVATQAVRRRFDATGTEALKMSTIDFSNFVRIELERAANAVTATGIPRQ